MEYFKDNPAKVLGVASALLALAAVYIPGLPQEAILAVVAVLIGGGLHAQKVEDQKTDEALMEATPDEAALERQMALLVAENSMLAQEAGEGSPCPCKEPVTVAPDITAEMPPVETRKPHVSDFSLDDGRALFRL